MSSLTHRETPPGCIVLAIDDPRNPGTEIEQIFPLSADSPELPVDVSNVGAFPAKQVIGDWQETSHQVLSSATQDSWAGGGQIEESSEVSDMDRYAEIASLETRFPQSLTLLPYTQELAGPNSNDVVVLGDLIVGGVKKTYVAYGVVVRALTTGVFPNVGLSGALVTLDGPPTQHGGTLFRVGGVTKMYIPLGTAGYQTYDGTTLSALITTIKPINFMVHSRKLWAVDDQGVIWKSLDGTTWINVWQLDPGYIVRGITLMADRSDAPAPHIVTDSMTFVLDEGVPAVYETELNYAPHPRAGVAFERWRTDLYVSIGMGIQRYTLGTVNAAGLDRDDGVGRSWAGYVSTLCRGFNDLFAGISASTVTGETVEEVSVDQGKEVYIGGFAPRCSVMRLTGGQAWHTAWVAPSAGGTVSSLYVSSANSDYRLLWGWRGKLYIQQLTTDFDNPRDNPAALFMPSGEITSSWLDMGMKADRMTMAAFEARASKFVTATQTVSLLYQIDDEDETETWHDLATLTESGVAELRLGENGLFPTSQTPQTRYDGVGFSRIRYRIRLESDDINLTPELKALVLVFIKRMRRLSAFTVKIDCSTPDHDGSWGLGNNERRRVLQALIDSEPFIPMMYRDFWVMVKVTSANGPEGTGNDTRGDIFFNCLQAWEIPPGGAN